MIWFPSVASSAERISTVIPVFFSKAATSCGRRLFVLAAVEVDVGVPASPSAPGDQQAGTRTSGHVSERWFRGARSNSYRGGRDNIRTVAQGLGSPNLTLEVAIRASIRENQRMHLTAKADYAVRAIVELADSSQESPRKVDDVAKSQNIPVSFLENILTQLRSTGMVRSQRGPEGGYWLARPPEEVNLADIIRAVEGPLVGVRGQRPEEVEYVGSSESLQQVWVALRTNLRKVLESVTVADVASGSLPKEVLALTHEEEAWHTR